jgi:cytochrome c oxidase assembly protein subunit 11
VDRSRSITVEFDANARGPWEFRPAQRSMQVHPGEMVTVMYEFQNVQNRRMAAQAIPSYAPMQAAAHFNKLQCFCFNQYTLEPGEKKSWPVVFVIDPKLSRDVSTITLSYTFFEVGGSVPAAPQPTAAARPAADAEVRS